MGKGEQQTDSWGFDACVSVALKMGYREQPQTLHKKDFYSWAFRLIIKRIKQKKQI